MFQIQIRQAQRIKMEIMQEAALSLKITKFQMLTVNLYDLECYRPKCHTKMHQGELLLKMCLIKNLVRLYLLL